MKPADKESAAEDRGPSKEEKAERNSLQTHDKHHSLPPGFADAMKRMEKG